MMVRRYDPMMAWQYEAAPAWSNGASKFLDLCISPDFEPTDVRVLDLKLFFEIQIEHKLKRKRKRKRGNLRRFAPQVASPVSFPISFSFRFAFDLITNENKIGKVFVS